MSAARKAVLAALLAASGARGAAPSSSGILADAVLDPNVPAIVADEGELLAHYAPPIVEGDAVYTEVKDGAWTGRATWETQTWGVRRWDWKEGTLVERWTYWSDWKPVPFAQLGTNPQGVGPLWEPVFQPASDGDRLWVPAARGAIDEIRKEDGARIARIRPFGAADGPSIFVTGPVVAAASGVYFDAISLDVDDPWDVDAAGSWLVRIAPGGAVTKKSFADLVPGAPAAASPCEISFPSSELPFPPSPDAVPPTVPCGSPRASVGAGPAGGPDGT
ncbi:MAG TPA: hypothetical protein VG777_05070, partial [Thermoanaerobaculia bacterium]|nr:hypothetical protein [Thermoanaerobaculia bacterium]